MPPPGAVVAFLTRPPGLAGLLALFGLGALATALASQYWGGLQPCVLCHYQRYAHGAAAAAGVAGLALAARPAAVRLCVALGALALLAGAAVAAFHVGVEQHWWQGTPGCHAPPIDFTKPAAELREALLATEFAACDQIPWALFGVSMAGYNFLFSLAVGLAVLWALGPGGRASRRAETP